jgi:hypothetical protein
VRLFSACCDLPGPVPSDRANAVDFPGSCRSGMADRHPVAPLIVPPLVDTPSRDEPDRVVSVLVDFTSGLSRPPSQCTPTPLANGYRPSRVLTAPTNPGLPALDMSTTESWTSRVTPRPCTSTMLPAPAQCLTTPRASPAAAEAFDAPPPALPGRLLIPAHTPSRQCWPPTRRVHAALAAACRLSSFG